MNEAHKLWGLFVRIQNTEREKHAVYVFKCEPCLVGWLIPALRLQHGPLSSAGCDGAR